MPARDNIHDALINALEKDGWEITHDPYPVLFGRRKGFVDLGAEKIIAATKGTEKIAVEGKGFGGKSEVTEFERALGQFIMYFQAIQDKEPERTLYLAVPVDFYQDFLSEPFFQILIKNNQLKIVVFNVIKEEIVSWIK